MSNINNENRKEVTTMYINKEKNMEPNQNKERELFNPIAPIGPAERALFKTTGLISPMEFYDKNAKMWTTEMECARSFRDNEEAKALYFKYKDDPRFDKRFKEYEAGIAEIISSGGPQEEIADINNSETLCKTTPKVEGKLSTNTNNGQLAVNNAAAMTSYNSVPATNDMYEMNSMQLADLNNNGSREKQNYSGYAKEFIRRIGVRIIGNKNFYIYNGRCYEEISKEALEVKIMEVFGDKVEAYGRANMVTEIMRFICLTPEINYKIFQPDLKRVSFENGVLNLETRQMEPHSPNNFVIYSINAKYLGSNIWHTPVYDSYMQNITGGDEVLKLRFLQVAGYILTPDTSAKKYFAFQGEKDSGKSIFVHLIENLFLDSAVEPMPSNIYGEKFSLKSLLGKMLSVSSDMSAAAIDSNSVGVIKQITGNDIITTDTKFGPRIKFKCLARIIMVTNHPIITKQRDAAFMQRAIVLPFRYTVSEDKQNHNLLNELLRERDMIVTNAINAYFDLVDSNYRFAGDYRLNEVVMSGNDGNDDAQTGIYKFAARSFVPHPDGFVFTSDAYELYRQEGGVCSENVFAQYFTRACEELYKTQRTRKRKVGESNPRWGLLGIKFIISDFR